MAIGQQLVHADIDEQWIAVTMFAVRAGRLHDLRDQMDVVGAVVREAGEPACRLDHAQRLVDAEFQHFDVFALIL